MSIDEVSISAEYIDEVGADRALSVPGVLNVRDLGGLTGSLGTVRRLTVLRSASLRRLNSAGARELARLGVRTVVDLRTAQEREEEPNRIAQHPELTSVREVRIELLETLDDLPPTSEGLYGHLVERCGPGIVEVYELLARQDAAHAVLIHCMVGKDRTGLTAALLLDLLGIPREVILADYEASNAGLGSTVVTKVRAQILAGTFAELDRRFHGPRGYLEAHGLTDETVSILRSTLLM